MGDEMNLKDVLLMSKSQLDNILKKDLVAIISKTTSSDLLIETAASTTDVDMSKILELINKKLEDMEVKKSDDTKQQAVMMKLV